MKIIDCGTFKKAVIDPGEYFASKEKVVITTLLGSCVAVCLFDAQNSVVGMNHFLLSSLRSPVGHGREAAKYGENAMELLISRMLQNGATLENMKAKVFGGGNVIWLPEKDDGILTVGDENCLFVREYLEKHGIMLKAQDLGGDHGRVIHFYSTDYCVYVRKIKGLGFYNRRAGERAVFKRPMKSQRPRPEKEPGLIKF